MSEKYEDYEKKLDAIEKQNKVYLTEFTDALKQQGLKDKTIKNHVFNVEFYINDFLNTYDAQEVVSGCYQVYEFLGDWFIRKAMWASCANIKASAASIKKFYKFMLERKYIETEDYLFLCTSIKENLPICLRKMKEYDDMEGFDW